MNKYRLERPLHPIPNFRSGVGCRCWPIDHERLEAASCAGSSPSGADAGAAPHVRRRRLFRQRLLTGVGSGAPRV